MTASDSAQQDAGRPPLGPLEGGRWRPVKPEELLRRDAAAQQDVDESKVPGPRRPPLERRQELERFIKDRPADMDAYLELAAIYRESGRTVEATRVLKIALEIEPSHPTVLWQLEEAHLARALQQLRDVKEVADRVKTPEAQRELERAQTDWACRRAEVCRERLARDPSAHRLRIVLGEALRDLGEFQEAITAVEGALQDDAESPFAYLLQGQCLQALGRQLEALHSFRRAALRRAVPAPSKVRLTALRAASEIAEILGLTASVELYRQALSRAEQESSENGQDKNASLAPLNLPRAPRNPPPVAGNSEN